MAPVSVKCPTCHRDVDWHSTPFRPFCSDRCRLIDLGAWLSERHAIPTEDAPAESGGDSDDPAIGDVAE